MNCAHCDAAFQALKPSARFCSPACRTAAYRARVADAGQTPGASVFGALRGRVTSHRPITGPMRQRARAI